MENNKYYYGLYTGVQFITVKQTFESYQKETKDGKTKPCAFTLKVYLQIFNNNEIDLKGFQKFISEIINQYSYENKSCESIADEIAKDVHKIYSGRFMTIEIESIDGTGVSKNYTSKQMEDLPPEGPPNITEPGE
jgi:hypothetical protein